jgi:hypothetical protein
MYFSSTVYIEIYRVIIVYIHPVYLNIDNYLRISLRYNLGRKCRKIVKFVSITHSERNIWNGPIVATVITREERKAVLEGNGCLTDRQHLLHLATPVTIPDSV